MYFYFYRLSNPDGMEHLKPERPNDIKYYKIETDSENVNYYFVEKLKELWSVIDSSKLNKFTEREKVS